MKKRSLILGLAVFVCSALIFNGCEQEADDDDGVETFTDVSDTYKARVDSGLTATAKKSDRDGTVYVTVTGDAILHQSTWGVAPTKAAPDWDYADISLDLSAIVTPASKHYGIKNSNQAFRYYTGYNGSFVTSDLEEAPDKPIVSGGGVGDPDVYIPASLDETAFKWKLYNLAGSTDRQGLSVTSNYLIASGDNPTKTFTLEIAEYSSYVQDEATKVADVAKIVVDYSGVTIRDPSALVSALGDTTKADVGIGATVVLKADTTVASGATTAVPTGIKLSVPVPASGGASTTLTVAGTLSVAGEFNVAGSASVSGKVVVDNGGKIVSPALTTAGLPDTTNKIVFTGSGEIELAQGAISYYGDTAFIGPAPATGTSPYLYNWDSSATGSKVTLKDSNVTELTSGNVSCVAALTTDNSPGTAIAPSTTIVIAADTTLTISKGFAVLGKLTINGKLEGETDAILVIGTDTSKVTVDGSGKSIFYPSDTTTAGEATKGTTYKWTADAGGSGTAGWKAQS